MTGTIGPLITDSNYRQFLGQGRRGYAGMWRTPQERAAQKTFADMGIPLIPEKDWDDIIDHLEKQQADFLSLADGCGLPVKDQDGTNYCWGNAPTHCCEYERLVETGQVVSYSPASICAPIKNFRNVGGWGSEALDYLLEHGINLTADWPDNAIDRRYDTEENRQAKQRNIVLERFVLNTWEERGSVILAGHCTADGYNWWSHEVTGVWIIKKTHDLIFDNSWSLKWGKNGRGTLSGNRKYADDSVAVCSMRKL